MNTKKVYINGRFVPEGKACISVFDRGLNYGDGVFETMKSFQGDVIFLKEHLLRLKKGMRTLGIPLKSVKYFEEDIKKGALKKLLRANALSEGYAYLKIIVTRGIDMGGHAPLKATNPTVIIISRPLEMKTISGCQKKGVRVTLIRGLGRALPGIKTLNFLTSVLGKAEAKKRGAFEGIFVSEDSRLIEGTSTNLFIVKGRVLKTPSAPTTPTVEKDSSRGALPGIMRKTVIEIAKKKRIAVEEASIYAPEIESCDEAFLTNSILDVVPVLSVDSRPVGKGVPGRITRLIQEALLIKPR